MSVFSSKFKKIAKKATAWSLAALTAAAGISSLPGVVTQVHAAATLSNEDRGVIFANSRTDFRDESIYFMMTTRFYDGDPSNNTWCWDGGESLNPNDPEWRGDFKGVIEKLDYIKALGFTAIWITPVVENCSGYDYHGYHAINHSKVDPRYESSDCTYQDMIDACHAKGIKVIQDIVLNHTGNFGETNLKPMFEKVGDLNTTDCLVQSANSVLPSDYDSMTPAQQYQARIACMKEDNIDTDNIYHHQKSLNWDDYTCQTAQIAGDCVDLNTENPVVYNYLVDCYTNYINMGVDAFRIDTVKHISRLTFNKVFNEAFIKAGKENGKDFFMFGEVCTRDRNVWYRGTPPLSAPFYTWKESKNYAWSDTDWQTNLASAEENYYDNGSTDAQSTSNNAFLNGNDYHTPDYSQFSGLSVIDFPMHWNFEDARSAFGVRGTDSAYNDATWNVTYVDSHDYAPDQAPENQRFARDQSTWAENLSLIFTWRGIPCIYYGSEIEFKKGCPIDVGPNAALEDTGRAYFGDHIEGTIDTDDFTVFGNVSGAVGETLNYPLAQHIIRLNRIRQAIPALRKGQYSTEGVSGDLAFKRRYTDANTDSFVCVAISGSATFSGIPNGTYVDAVTGDTQTVSGGTLSVNVSGKGNMKVYVLNTAKTPAPGRVIPNGAYLTDGGAAENIGPVAVNPGPAVEVQSVSLDKTSISIPQATTAKVTATVSPSNATSKSLKWTSSNESVATVSGGTIKGISIGTATITATSNNGKSASVKVTVTKNADIVDATGVTLSPTSLTLTTGKTGTLTATVSPSNATDKTVTWTSSNESVAKVSAGTVTAVAEGTATITAKTSNGKTATATVTVEGKKMTYINNGVYFEKPSGWGSTIYAYIYGGASETQITGAWPGKAMTEVGDGVYAYEFTTDLTNVKVIFNDGNSQAPASQQPGFEFKNKGYYTTSGFQKVVEPVQDTAVTSVSVSPTSASVKVGATTTLTAAVSPSNATNKTISWTSSNTNVATVSNGVVTGVSAGTATITATSNNGKTAKATITVTGSTSTLVNNSKVSATSVKLGSTITATAAASGGTSPYQYQIVYKKSTQSSWTTASAYSTNKTATIKPASTGAYQICIKVKDNNGTEIKKFFDITVTNSTALTNTSKISATSINLGSSVTLTGSATGGTSPYTYAVLYKQTSQTTWTTKQNYSSTNKVTVTPAKATTYDVCIKVKDKSGTIEKKFFTVTVKAAALTNTSKLSATTINLGSTITVTGAASGGTGSYTYAVLYKQKSQSSWTTKQNYSSTKTVSIKPAQATTYDVCVKVKDSSGTIVKKFFDVTVKKALTNTSKLSATSITLGKTITATASATGGTGYYNFAVLYKRTSQSTWTTAQAFKPNETVTFKPATATTYDVCVKVQDSAGTIEKKFFTVKVTNAALVNNSTLSATSIKLGSTVTATGAATGGTGSYTYAVLYKQTAQSDWTIKQNYSSTKTVSIKPAKATTYDVCVKVKDSAGTIVKKFFTVKVTNPALTNTSTLSATSIKLGSTVTVKASATGGQTSYKYAVYYKQKSQSTWTTKQDFSTNASVSIKPAAITTYDICVKVKDAAGTIEKKYFTLTVTSNLANNSTVSAASVTKGNSVTVKCAASGGTSPYTYKTERMEVGGTSGWTTIQNSTAASVSVKIPAAATYQIRVTVTDGKKATAVKYFTVTGK